MQSHTFLQTRIEADEVAEVEISAPRVIPQAPSGKSHLSVLKKNLTRGPHFRPQATQPAWPQAPFAARTPTTFSPWPQASEPAHGLR